MSNAHKDRIGEDFWGVHDLVVEVIFNGTIYRDRMEKFVEYSKASISEYWLVDPAKRTIEVFTLEHGAYVLLEKWDAGEIAHSEVLARFEIAVDDITG